MATLRVKRSSEFVNRFRNLELVLNGQPLGKIANGETKEFTIAPGRHRFKSTIDWAGSPEITVDLAEDEVKTVEVKAFSGAKWLIRMELLLLPLFILMLLMPRLFTEYQPLESGFLLLVAPPFLWLTYKLTLGRKNYLELKVK